ncbi:hypothetical protein ACH492_36985 [Streptomyces sp. NPDC019443]|uniref:hypothetical protein n=1 Tax=Streptomyces sp. NPDC019443 TaxID=3365061 RepID=UPI0037918F00
MKLKNRGRAAAGALAVVAGLAVSVMPTDAAWAARDTGAVTRQAQAGSPATALAAGDICQVSQGSGHHCWNTDTQHSIGIRNIGDNPVEVKRNGDPRWYRIEPGRRMELNGLDFWGDTVRARAIGGNSFIRHD